jgi:glycosyltransferase involved in cell wall biosynthesis
MTNDAPVPQRCVLVLPSTGEFDSRSWRIAGSLAARGHTVTVVARSAPGLPDDEMSTSGYRVLRVPVSASDGLPGPLRRLVRRPGGHDTVPGGAASSGMSAVGVAAPKRGATGARFGGPLGTLARGLAGGWRLAAIGLTIRSQRMATVRISPGADVVHAMAYMGIPVGLALGRRDGAATVYDARDIYVDARNIARLPGLLRRLFASIERRWARAADRVITVNDPYADVMADRFGVERPLVVLNCSLRAQAPVARGRRFHEALGLPDDRRVVLYHGGLSRDRGIEQLLDAIPAIPDATLVLMGYGDLEASIRARAASPALAGRVAVLPAVPPAELIAWVGSADVAAMPIQPTTLNHRLTTPNKLFEAIAAGVPVVASDLPGMAPIVLDTGCGVVVDPTDPGAIAAAIHEILDGQPERRAAIIDGVARAGETYSWEFQAEILIAEYGRLTGRPW